MLRSLFVLPPALLLALLLALLPQQPASTPDKSMPADAATLVNPVTATAESRAHAKMMYGIDCAICHGANGNGKGELVDDMQLKLKDLTDPSALKDMSDGELFYIIKNGKGKMPAEADRAKDDAIWNMVILVRSLAKK
jgi:mono/diheme cytochrome c family protein